MIVNKQIKRFCITISFVAKIGMFAVMLFTGTEIFSAPIIVLPVDSIDLGDLEQSNITSNTLEVKNAGDENLEITSIKTNSCCSRFDCFIDKKIILPGDSGLITILFESSGVNGKVEEPQYIFSNDKKTPSVKFSVKAFVKPKIMVLPPKCIFRNPGKAPVKRLIVLKNIVQNHFNISNINADSDIIKTDIIPADSDYYLSIQINYDKIKPQDFDKEINVYVSLVDDGMKTLKLTIPVIVYSAQ